MEKLKDVIWEKETKPTASFQGEGRFKREDGTESETSSFCCIQQPNGRILLTTYIDKISYLFENWKSFEGHTENGEIFKAHLNISAPIRNIEEISVYSVNDFSVKRTSSNQRTLNQINFFVSNFLFSGLKENDLSNSREYTFEPDSLPLKLEENFFTLRKVDEYGEVEEKLKLWGSPRQTVIATTSLDNSDEINSLKHVMSNLSTLMSFARGTTVNWTGYEVTDNEGQVVTSYYYNARVNRFVKRALIPQKFQYRLTTKKYLEQTYPRFENLNKDNWLRNSISAFIDVLSEGDHLELRGLKAVTLMEFMTNYYLENFKGWSHGKVKYYDFKDSIEKLVKYSGLYPTFNNPSIISLKDIENFKDHRNSLVHEMSYENLRGSGRLSAPEKLIEYFFLFSTISKIILGTLGYRGEYLDWNEFDLDEEQMPTDLIVQI